MVLKVREFIININTLKAHSFILNRATLLDRIFPGPLIAAKKVGFCRIFSHYHY